MGNILAFDDATPADDLLDGLNDQQRDAVSYRGKALLIVAGAGSGKTRVLTHRIAALLRDGVWPSQILAITFTNKAAAEMRERVGGLVGDGARGMWISTFHSACVRILRREAEQFGFTNAFTIYDSGDSRALIKRLVREHRGEAWGLTPAGVHGRMSKLKNELIDAETFARDAGDPADRLFADIFREYQRTLQRANAFDFDDLIAQTVFLFRAFPHVADTYRRRFKHVLVDEYQDTNHAQYALIRELTTPGASGSQHGDLTVLGAGEDGASITVVGDSDQSIYAFRGADIRNITEFERDFSGAKVVLLEQNYRSTQTILDAANAVIGNNFDRVDKKLWSAAGAGEQIVGYTGYSQHDEAQFVVDEIERLAGLGMRYEQMAVFYRTNSQSRALEEMFIRAAVPYTLIGGTKFYERAEVKDALAYLIAVANPADELALRRILNRPRRGIGDVTAATIARYAGEHGITFRDALGHAADLGVGPKLQASISSLDELLAEGASILTRADGSSAQATSVTKALQHLLDGSGYLDALRSSDDPQDEARLENLDELLAVTRDFARNSPQGTIVDFLTDVALVADSDELDDETGRVSLMTLHTAKGLEFDAVFVTGVEEDLLPHRISANEPGGPQEERRLFYVGVTRARKRLHLSLAMTRAQFGEVAVAAPSRFLREIPAGLIDWKQTAEQIANRSRPAPRSSDARPFGSSDGLRPRATAMDRFPGLVSNTVRDNGDLELAAGDRIRHDDFGDGTVDQVTGVGAKRIAHVRFDSAGAKKLLIKVAPITKL